MTVLGDTKRGGGGGGILEAPIFSHITSTVAQVFLTVAEFTLLLRSLYGINPPITCFGGTFPTNREHVASFQKLPKECWLALLDYI